MLLFLRVSRVFCFHWGGMGWALGGARNRNPVGEFLLVRLGSSLCASSGLVLCGVRKFRSEIA